MHLYDEMYNIPIRNDHQFPNATGGIALQVLTFVATVNYDLVLEIYGTQTNIAGVPKFIKSRGFMDKALAIDPNYKAALFNKGRALNNLGNYTQAILSFDKLLALDPNDKYALNDKGRALNGLGNYIHAITYLDRRIDSIFSCRSEL
jgi:tetratricopeptide (TPR) repeat protein